MCGGAMWLAAVLLVAGFYAAEAQMVFLFPEALLGRRVPWRSSRAMTVAAGGTLQVMASVLPIAARMAGRSLPNDHGKIVEVDAGHQMMAEQPDAVLDALYAFAKGS